MLARKRSAIERRCDEHVVVDAFIERYVRGITIIAREVYEPCLRFGLDETARVLQLASLSFDGAVCEIFTALASGATLHLARREEMVPGPPLAALLADQGITCLTAPPSALALIPPERPVLGR